MMNVVGSGSRYQIYGEDVKTYTQLPAGSYNVEFAKMAGFYLTSRSDLTVTEEKVYGHSEEKVEKVMKSYHMLDRNLGVLLSGQKGIGKSLFVRMLADRALQEGIPVIVVTTAYPGIADFLSTIEQDCVVVFDEFEKTFADQEEWHPQDEMLSLFDGLDGGHRLFLVTCNDLSKLSQYMINRPGRFHYHFSMTAPTADDIRVYMEDKLEPQYHDNIKDIVMLAGVTDMPYDYLRAIAFELNQGYSLQESLNDLNITRADDIHFDIDVYLSDGTIYSAWHEKVNFTNNRSCGLRFRNYDKKHEFYMSFYPSRATMVNGEIIITEGINFPRFDEDDFWDWPEESRKAMADAINSCTVTKMVLKKCPEYGPARLVI